MLLAPSVTREAHVCRWPRRLTVVGVEGIGRQAQCGAAVVALEAAAVEELCLGAQPLHHIDPLPAEEADVAAADVGGKLSPERALWGGGGASGDITARVRGLRVHV